MNHTKTNNPTDSLEAERNIEKGNNGENRTVAVASGPSRTSHYPQPLFTSLAQTYNSDRHRTSAVVISNDHITALVPTITPPLHMSMLPKRTHSLPEAPCLLPRILHTHTSAHLRIRFHVVPFTARPTATVRRFHRRRRVRTCLFIFGGTGVQRGRRSYEV